MRERLWKDLSRWGLLDLSDFVSSLVKPAYPGFEINPWLEFSAPDLPHPERCGYDNQRWLLGAHWAKSDSWSIINKKCTDYYYPDDQATWPGNIHPDVSDQDYAGIAWNSNKVGGVDMGANARLWGRTYFYMGDTWRRGPNVGQFYDQDPDWCEFPWFWCSEDAVRNDAIAFSVDDDPTDGVDLTVFSEATGDTSFPTTFRGIGIPGVHNFAPDDMWDSSYPVAEPQFTTTSSAATVAVPFPSGDLVYSIPMVVVTYTSASSPEWDHTYNLANNNCTSIDTDDCAVPHARKTPKTHIACSYDGVHFFACYQDLYGMLMHPVPLSESGFHYQDCQNRVAVYGPDPAGRFLGSSLVEVGPADLKSMCVGIGGNPPYAPDSQMCELYDEELGYGGLLVYGQARPTPKSPLFIAFIKASEIGLVDQQGKPEIWYFTDEDPLDPNPELPSWSRDELDAKPLPDADWNDHVPCDQLSETSRGCETLNPPRHYPPENCQVSSAKPSFGAFPLSLALVRDGTEDQNGVQRPEVLIAYKKGAAVYRTAPVSAPWDISGEKDFCDSELDCAERVDGYGNHIIHGNPDIYFQFENGELSFWHVVSTWDNVNPLCCPKLANDGKKGPYGTYTRKETIPWPPTEQ